MLQKQPDEIIFYKSKNQNSKKNERPNKNIQQQHVEDLVGESETLKQRKINLQNEYENEKLRECTFSPCIVNENSYRSANQVLDDMKKAEQKKAMKLLQLKNEQEEKTKEVVSFQPNKSCSSCWFSNASNVHLSPSLGQSVSLLKSPNQSKLSKLSNVSCHDRLYNNAKQKWIKTVMPGKENQPPVEELQLEVMSNRSKISGFFSPQSKIVAKKQYTNNNNNNNKNNNKSPCISQLFEKSYYESRKGNISEYLYAEGLEKMSQKGRVDSNNLEVISNVSSQYMNKAQDLNLSKMIIKELMQASYEVFDSENEQNIVELMNQKLTNKTMNYNQIWQVLIRIGFFNQVNLNNQFMSGTQEININQIELSSQQQSQLENQYSQLNRMLEFINLDINGQMNLKVLCVFILVILGAQISNQIWLLINEEFGSENELTEIESEQIKLLKNSSYLLFNNNNNFQGDSIRKQFNSLAKTRMTTAGQRRKQPAQAPQQQTFLSARSRQLSNQRRTKLLQLSPESELSSHCSETTIKTYADVLFLERQVAESKIVAMKNQLKEKEMSKCTFKPKINDDKWSKFSNNTLENQENWQHENLSNNSQISYKKTGKIPNSPLQRSQDLYEISQRFQQRVDRPAVEIEYEQQQNECTFNPNLIAEQKKNRLNQVPLREAERNAIEKNIQRIERGREVNEYLLRSHERSPEIIARNPLMMKQENAQKQFNKNSSNQSMNESQNLPQPISIAEIHLSPSYSEKIYIYPGDSSLKLAQQFAAKHQLDYKMTKKLEEMLENKILSSLQ